MTTSAKSLLGLAWGLLGLTWVLRNTDEGGTVGRQVLWQRDRIGPNGWYVGISDSTLLCFVNLTNIPKKPF
jgi:hypothetical protein